MADELNSATVVETADATVPGSFLDAAADVPETPAAPEAQGETAEATSDDPLDPKTRDRIRGLEGGNKQQREQIKELKDAVAKADSERASILKELEELRKERQQTAQTAEQNRIRFEINQRVQQGLAEEVAELDELGVYDERQRQRRLDKRRAELEALEGARYEAQQNKAQAEQFRNANLTRAQQEATIANRDRLVGLEAARLTEQLAAVLPADITRTVTASEIIARLKRPLDANDAFDEMLTESKALFKEIVADAKKAARKADLAERDANGVDTFERGGNSGLSPSEIFRRFGEGDPSITYQQAIQAEKALGIRH